MAGSPHSGQVTGDVRVRATSRTRWPWSSTWSSSKPRRQGNSRQVRRASSADNSCCTIDLHGRLVDDQDFDNPDHYEAAVLTHSSLQDRDHSVLATTHDESPAGQNRGDNP